MLVCITYGDATREGSSDNGKCKMSQQNKMQNKKWNKCGGDPQM